ncbi:hypothetical protein BCR32DRAFT_330131 [Anaeromyces robustus]|uniref:Uncharacterized protein n=1 Tax=Anaeromyces robustus TaxID=1754192 RepID=A0A1Y1WA25_9FUNG|nr:hypothetical protein BCR32DRAFT_330131 [Anaeromyces robustus]|eukprot:ORX70397.1 hypothetical protein BCR32DRAFT_330131 [Anaeromyces robustus]
MNKLILSTLLFVVLLGSFINTTVAKSNGYIIGIRRNKNDGNFERAPQSLQKAIVKLVNERMNDIYDIIQSNREAYSDNDRNLNELDDLLVTWRNTYEKRFQFINYNRPESNLPLNEDLVPFESNLVKFIAPITNYYTIWAQLSDKLVDEVKSLPNVISVEKNNSGDRNTYTE